MPAIGQQLVCTVIGASGVVQHQALPPLMPLIAWKCYGININTIVYRVVWDCLE